MKENLFRQKSALVITEGESRAIVQMLRHYEFAIERAKLIDLIEITIFYGFLAFITQRGLF